MLFCFLFFLFVWMAVRIYDKHEWVAKYLFCRKINANMLKSKPFYVKPTYSEAIRSWQLTETQRLTQVSKNYLMLSKDEMNLSNLPTKKSNNHTTTRKTYPMEEAYNYDILCDNKRASCL